MKLKCSVCGETKFESIYHCGQPMEEVSAQYDDLIYRINETYRLIKNDNIEFPDATEYTQGAKGYKRYVLNLFDTCVPEAKEVQDDTD